MLKNYKIRASFLLGCLILLALLSGLATTSNFTQNYLLILIPAMLMVIWQLFLLIDKTNKRVSKFLADIRYDDYEAHFSESTQLSASERALHRSFNQVIDKFRNIRSEKEAQFQYLQAIVENVDTGLICFNAEGQTVLINKGLQQILHKSYFPNFENIRSFNQTLFDALEGIVPGERKLVRLVINNQIVQLAIRKTILRMKTDSLHLFALQNIHAELEEQEVNSWQKLIRILTHEIMNSITPVVSLSSTAKDMLREEDNPSEETQEDIKKAIEAIHRRSSGLLHFTQAYRQLTKIPPPRLESTNLIRLIENVLTLLGPELEKKSIQLEKLYRDQHLTANLDPDLMEQVLINLIKNAMEALDHQAEAIIRIHILHSREGTTEIQISDNGPGIPAKLLDKIFIPFFTTKDEGSGIGLSLSRQIVQLHKGNLHVNSEPGKGTVFTIRL
ncbi:MAG: ATP-binding protein [Saprospiraceae bacterium]|nr:ATP-binding protein [Saprospiraceae bacterium]